MFKTLARIVLFQALLCGTPIGWAAPPQRPAFDDLAQALELRPEQVAPVRAVFEAAWAKRAQSRQVDRERRVADREALDRELAALLGPEQMQRLRAWRQTQPRPGRPQRPLAPGAAQ